MHIYPLRISIALFPLTGIYECIDKILFTMNYTIVIKKVIREIIGIISIVLFIYTCTKIRTVAARRQAVKSDTATISWPVRTAAYHSN